MDLTIEIYKGNKVNTIYLQSSVDSKVSKILSILSERIRLEQSMYGLFVNEWDTLSDGKNIEIIDKYLDLEYTLEDLEINNKVYFYRKKNLFIKKKYL